MRTGLLAAVAVIALAAPSFAQTPCYTADACRQQRVAAEQYQQQQAAARAAEQERQQQAAIAEQRRAEAERRQAALRAQQAALRAEQARMQAVAEAERRAEAQLAAENSSDNYCKEPKLAGQLIQDFNSLFNGRREVIDIEHLTTLRFDPQAKQITCHGAFVLTNGIRMAGTLSYQPNVAGDVITRWQHD